jgi:hypothetical protein
LLFEVSAASLHCAQPTAHHRPGSGRAPDYFVTLNITEIAPDVTAVACKEQPLQIFSDDQLDGRRIVVADCADPTAST